MVKFGQGVYWGDGSWWAQIMGVVGGGRLTVGGGKLRAGNARPLQGGEREIVGRPALRPPRTCMGAGMVSGHLCRGRRPRRPAEGSRPLPTVWGETGCVKQ